MAPSGDASASTESPPKVDQPETPAPVRSYGKITLAAPPHDFDGKKDNFQKWWKQIILYITAYEDEFEVDLRKADQKKIIFTLSFMNEGQAELWADDYREQAIEQGNWGTWRHFVEEVKGRFLDSQVAERAMRKLQSLRQNKTSAEEWFQEIDLLRRQANLTYRNEEVLIANIRMNGNPTLVDKVIGLDHMPTTYEGWKKKMIQFDNQWRAREDEKKLFSQGHGAAIPRVYTQQQSNAPRQERKAERPATVPASQGGGSRMDVDRKRQPRGRNCYRCGKEGHFARDCSEPKPDRFARVRALGMTKEDLESFLKEGFQKDQ